MNKKITEDLESSIGQRIKEFYTERFISASTFADKCGINRTTLYKIINDKCDFQVSTLQRIKTTFPDFSIDYCLFGNNIPKQGFNNNGSIFIQNSDNNNNISTSGNANSAEIIREQMEEIIESNNFYRDMVKQTTDGMFGMMKNITSISESFKSIVLQLQENYAKNVQEN